VILIPRGALALLVMDTTADTSSDHQGFEEEEHVNAVEARKRLRRGNAWRE
jgi:hypothetical protein